MNDELMEFTLNELELDSLEAVSVLDETAVAELKVGRSLEEETEITLPGLDVEIPLLEEEVEIELAALETDAPLRDEESNALLTLVGFLRATGVTVAVKSSQLVV